MYFVLHRGVLLCAALFHFVVHLNLAFNDLLMGGNREHIA